MLCQEKIMEFENNRLQQSSENNHHLFKENLGSILCREIV